MDIENSENEDNLETGRVFHDKHFGEGSKEGVEKAGRYGVITESSIECYRNILRETSKDRNVLDYGCGKGLWSHYIAGWDARTVTGIDISEVGIEQA